LAALIGHIAPAVQHRLLFVSPRFLFPADSGGKIRTVQILRGMKDGVFEITLVSPEPPSASPASRDELHGVCDRFVGWQEPRRGPLFPFTRLMHAFSRAPIPVATDRTIAGSRVVAQELARRPDVVVFDFAHAAVLGPERHSVPAVLFTHNVESWIFRRHAEVARNPLLRAAWRSQWRKMERFERQTLTRFHTVVAVSEDDGRFFREQYRTRDVQVIPTGVDLGFFAYAAPGDDDCVVFTGSMDWIANQDGIGWLMREVWPRIASARPAARMRVVGRRPPSGLVQRANGLSWTFTGFVEDVRPHVHGCSAFVIPLRVGGGTRIKAFEAMAMGCPVVSTSIGVEGLPLQPDVHYLQADSPKAFAAAVLRLLREPNLRSRLSRAARSHVEANFSAERSAAVFERICLDAMRKGLGQGPVIHGR
jgi:glycosyltransferase involved in cell wall biosynthesis